VFPLDSVYQELLKPVHVWQSYSKKQNGGTKQSVYWKLVRKIIDRNSNIFLCRVINFDYSAFPILTSEWSVYIANVALSSL